MTIQCMYRSQCKFKEVRGKMTEHYKKYHPELNIKPVKEASIKLYATKTL